MRWVIERNLFFANDQMRFVNALAVRGSPRLLVDFVPFLHDILPDPGPAPPLVAMGSTNFIRTVIKKGWKPGAWYNDNFSSEVWSRHLGNLFLNNDGIVQTFGGLQFEGVRFVRPCLDLKAFSGMLVHATHIDEWRDAGRQYDVMSEENVLSDDTLVLVAPPKAISREFRFFVVGQQAVSGCQYTPLPEDHFTAASYFIAARDFAQRVSQRWEPAEAYVMDIARLPDNTHRVIEYNCLNAAGLYECPVDPIIEAIENLVASRPHT
jgi:hypothetical protein